MGGYCLSPSIFGEKCRGVGDEISFKCFIFNVYSGISFCLYDCCEYLNVGAIMATISERNIRSLPCR